AVHQALHQQVAGDRHQVEQSQIKDAESNDDRTQAEPDGCQVQPRDGAQVGDVNEIADPGNDGAGDQPEHLPAVDVARAQRVVDDDERPDRQADIHVTEI